MTTPAAIQATFSDLRFIKTRKVCQLIMEIPIEQANVALDVLGGVPMPMSEVWVGIARIQANTALAKPKRNFAELSRAQQAGILCSDEGFQKFVEANDEEEAARVIRVHCNVGSRADLDRDEYTKQQWDDLVSLYRQGNIA